MEEFARGGLDGTPTEAIAARVGVSQPYLFRLFGTKKDLFLAAVDGCFDRTLSTFQRAAEGHTGQAALLAMGASYVGLLEDRNVLLLQLQAYVACDDPDIRTHVRDGVQAPDHVRGRGLGRIGRRRPGLLPDRDADERGGGDGARSRERAVGPRLIHPKTARRQEEVMRMPSDRTRSLFSLSKVVTVH